mmetsp:Transcript_65419/g.104171  ORF Transcript_65419/g.104171 Transcript_65419/m.104171 type:complete len:481 (-) Transcript_65419:108-1550(-)
MAAVASNPQAVDTLATMFPTIERPQIKNILENECQGDSTRAIVILTKIDQFNKNMNGGGAAGTANGGEQVVVTAAGGPQQIPLQVMNQGQVVHAQPVYAAGVAGQDDCCGSCECCLLKPASYRNGLYRIDYKMYDISFVAFAVFSFYSEISIDSLDPSYHGFYLPSIALIFFFFAGLFYFFVKKPVNDISLKNINFARGALYILGGVLYLLGYIVHAVAISEYTYNYYEYYYYWDDGIYAEPEYLVGRGLFIGFHAIFIGYLYVTSGRLCSVCRGEERVQLVRLWTFFQLIYVILCLGFILPFFYMIIYMAMSPAVLVISLFLNCCLMKKSNEAGGCNSGASLGLIIVVSYYFALAWYILFTLVTSLSWYSDYEAPGWYVLWELSLFAFGSMHLWVLNRAMHPVAANCGCVQDGSGDGNVSRLGAQPQPVQQVVVVQQPQTVQTVVVTTNNNNENKNVDDEEVDGDVGSDQELYAGPTKA